MHVSCSLFLITSSLLYYCCCHVVSSSAVLVWLSFAWTSLYYITALRWYFLSCDTSSISRNNMFPLTTGPKNPFQGAISFDNVGRAWTAIFLVISLEGWTEIMYYVQDAHSFWDWIYFVLLIVVSLFIFRQKLFDSCTQYMRWWTKRDTESKHAWPVLVSTSSLLMSQPQASCCHSLFSREQYLMFLFFNKKRCIFMFARLDLPSSLVPSSPYPYPSFMPISCFFLLTVSLSCVWRIHIHDQTVNLSSCLLTCSLDYRGSHPLFLKYFFLRPNLCRHQDQEVGILYVCSLVSLSCWEDSTTVM